MNPFKIGMKLEADDIRNSNRLCVATIGDVIDSRVLVTLDGLESSSNFWTDIRSPYIHPINFHLENGYSIANPPCKCFKLYSLDLIHFKIKSVIFYNYIINIKISPCLFSTDM